MTLFLQGNISHDRREPAWEVGFENKEPFGMSLAYSDTESGFVSFEYKVVQMLIEKY
jgi:hypothetical protein